MRPSLLDSEEQAKENVVDLEAKRRQEREEFYGRFQNHDDAKDLEQQYNFSAADW